MGFLAEFRCVHAGPRVDGNTTLMWMPLTRKADDSFEWTRFHAAKARNVSRLRSHSETSRLKLSD